MRAGSKVIPILIEYTNADDDSRSIADGDVLFFFNYRSDRMREIVSVLGLPEKPMEVTVPKDLVRPPMLSISFSWVNADVQACI
jgi:bisphosphoglycerate-independent phosphoglycerate mutase (AlkP superfamily)